MMCSLPADASRRPAVGGTAQQADALVPASARIYVQASTPSTGVGRHLLDWQPLAALLLGCGTAPVSGGLAGQPTRRPIGSTPLIAAGGRQSHEAARSSAARGAAG